MRSIEEVNQAVRASLETTFKAVADNWLPKKGRLDLWRSYPSPILQMPPGSGKTHHATALVNDLYDKHGIPTLYLVLEHERGTAVKGRESWTHWYGHGDKRWNCDKAKEHSLYRSKGYNPLNECDCSWSDQFKTDRPTIAPLNYILALDLPVLRGGINVENIPYMRPEVEKFPVMVIDEIDFSRFVGRMEANLGEVGTVAETHPEPRIKDLCSHLAQLMRGFNASGDEQWSGAKLYDKLSSVTGDGGTILEALLRALEEPPCRPTERSWMTDQDVCSLPTNFPPYLVPILTREISHYLNTEGFNPRLHLIRGVSGPVLCLRWRRWAWEPLASIIMDATADPILVKKIFPEANQGDFQSISLPLPDNVRAYQEINDTMGKGTLGLYPFNKGKKSRQGTYKELRNDLRCYDRKLSIGLVTFKDIEKEVTAEIKGLGFANIKSLYYGNLRSANKLRTVDILILLGCPIPNPTDFLAEAQAFFYDEEPFTIPDDIKKAWTKDYDTLSLKNRGSVDVKVGGYHGDTRLNTYFRQKCQIELYQALHRCRPHQFQAVKPKEILIYTNMPIPGVHIDGALGWPGRYATTLGKLLSKSTECSVPDLARAVIEPEEEFNTVEIRIRRNTEPMAELAAVEWDDGAKRFRTRLSTLIS